MGVARRHTDAMRSSALALVLAAAALGAGPDPALGRAATLVPAQVSPLKLKGSSFLRRERVRVTVTPTAGTAVVRRVRARADGSFVLAFPRVSTCGGFAATAVGR